MALFEITPLDEKPEDEANRLKNKDPGFMAGTPTATELGPEAPALDFTGVGNTVPPDLPSEKELVASKQQEIADIKKAQADRLAEATATVNSMLDSQGALGESLNAFDKVTNTSIGDVRDLSSINLTGALSLDKFNFGNGAFPNPADYGADLSSIVDLSSVNLSQWGLPKPKLGKKDNNCWTLDDILSGLCGDLESYDARQDPLPKVNYSDSKYDDFQFPPGTDRSNVPLTNVADVSSVDMCQPLDLFSLDWPDFDLPNISNPFGALDLSGIMGSISGFLSGMAGDGDLINLSAFSGVLNGIKCAGALIADALVPDAIAEALSNFSIPGFDSDGLGFIEDSYKDVVNNAMYLVSDNWIWLDKGLGIYNFDNLSRVSPSVIRIMGTDTNSKDIAGLAEALRTHRTTLG
jgi:hypothetical protein